MCLTRDQKSRAMTLAIILTGFFLLVNMPVSKDCLIPAAPLYRDCGPCRTPAGETMLTIEYPQHFPDMPPQQFEGQGTRQLVRSLR